MHGGDERDDEKTTQAGATHTPGDSHDRTTPAPAPGPDIDEGDLAAAVESVTRAVESVRWSSDDYRPVITSQAQVNKLKLSAVAPLVAAAGGLRTITRDRARAWGEDKIGGSPNSAQRKQFQQLCTPAGMLMPWYRPDTLKDAYTAAERLGVDRPSRMTVASYQVRPDEPKMGQDGKPRKYENLMGQTTVVGVHPSTPRSWLTGTRVLLTEGLLKGASALTGLLLAGGVPVEELALTEDEKDSTADVAAEKTRDRLTDLMARVPARDRILILVVVGVGNWHHNPEWNSIDLRGGRELVVAFDGDLETNPGVYSQARQLFEFVESKGGDPSWLRIPDDGDTKRGIDDYLTTGTFDELLKHTATELPEAPEAPTVLRPGDTRMNEAELRYEKFNRAEDEHGTVTTSWSPVSDIIGRVSATVQRRPATDEELETGRFDPRAHDNAEGDVEIEVSYHGKNGRVDAAVRGPARLLAEQPDRWHRNESVHVPVKVLEHPDWPPRDQEWIGAAKNHRVEDRTEAFVWTHMGWVPTTSGSPVFIAGNSVVGDRGDASAHTTPGITDREVPAASRFGLAPLVDDNGRMDRPAVAQALRKVLDTYTAGAWRSDGVAAIALAAALRPCVPINPHTVIFFSGARRSGKALPLHTKIPTPVGHVMLGDIQAGDTVLAGDGTPTQVRGLSTTHRDACLTVHLADGRSLTTSTGHLWRTRTPEQAAAGHPAPTPDILAGLESLSSGRAGTVTELAGALGIDEAVLGRWVDDAGIPNEVLASTAGPVVVYPVGEVLALASAMRGADGTDRPVPFTTVTATTLAAMLTDTKVQVDDGTGGWVDVTGVTRGDETWVRCLTVDHYTGTFRAGDSVATHNSWTAKQIMSFWQATPGAFDRSLPGTAADTGYYTENAVSRTPIWVADDVAPTVDKRKAEATEAKIGDIIRAVHNQASKGRMNPNGSSRELMRPRALVMVTAENPQAAASEMDRVVHVVTGEAFFGDDQAKSACDALTRESRTANSVVTACIQMIASSVNREGSWPDVITLWRKYRDRSVQYASQLMGGTGKAARHAEMAGDLLLGLDVLKLLCREVGVYDDYRETLSRLRNALVSYVNAAYSEADSSSPGTAVIRALRSALASGAIHLGHPTSGQPPFQEEDADEQVRVNQLLGWSYPSTEGQGERPGGRRVGLLVRRDDQWYALLDPTAAFSEAQRAHPEIILHGSRSEPTWVSAWNDGMASGPWRRKRGNGGRMRPVVRVALGSHPMEAVPVPLNTLLGLEPGDEDGGE